MAGTQTKAISLKEKIGQMLILGFDGKTINKNDRIVQAIMHENIGGVILFDFNFKTKQFDKNIESPKQLRHLNQDLQSYTAQGNSQHNRPELPLFISVDYEGGKVNRLHERYGFPPTLSAKDFAKQTISEARVHAETMAKTLKSNGFNVDFAPVVDVDVNPDNPVIGKIGRSYSDDPSIVSLYSEVFSTALEQQGVACVYKHFPGHGSSTKDSHLGFVDVTDTWQSYELLPYEQALQNETACPIIMTAHIVNRNLDPTGLPATLSKPVLTELLRQRLSFEGVVVTDDMQMKAISDHYGLEKAVTMAINAGADMLVFGNQLSAESQTASELITLIERNVKSGLISEERVNESYQRITTLKLQLAQ